MILLALALMGCGDPPPDAGASAYHRALKSDAGYAAAAAACQDIADERVRGDCLLAVMERWEHLDPASCDALTDPVWADECRFQLAERQRAAGKLAIAIQTCEGTRFRRSCAWHLLQDEAQAAATEDAAAAEERLAPFRASRSIPDAPLQFWKMWFRERSADDHALDEAVCAGLAAPRACERAVDAYVRGMLDELGRRDPQRLCRQERGLRARTGGGPAWRMGPIAGAAEDRWVHERCGDGAPPPPTAAGLPPPPTDRPRR